MSTSPKRADRSPGFGTWILTQLGLVFGSGLVTFLVDWMLPGEQSSATLVTVFIASSVLGSIGIYVMARKATRRQMAEERASLRR